MKWNLEWLRTFKAIYETGTLTAAAQELFISQPGVSLHLNSLEAYTGYKLFERTAKKMTPTEKGKILYNFVVAPLEKLERGEKHFHKRSQQERNTISVGMCFETFQYTLEKYIPTLPFNLIIKFGEYPQMLQDLDNGLLDLIITPHKGTQQNIDYKDFAKERIVPNISSIIRCLSEGDGFSVVPDFLCKEAVCTGKIKVVWEGNMPLENTLYFGTRKKTIYQQEVEVLEKLLTKEWGSK